MGEWAMIVSLKMKKKIYLKPSDKSTSLSFHKYIVNVYIRKNDMCKE